MALGVGIDQVSVYKVFVRGPDENKEVVSAETSTPRAKAFVDALFSKEWFDVKSYSVTARELRAILGQHPISELTQPMVEPAIDVLQDLWQLSHITPSYIGRAFAAAVLLAYAMFQNSAISIVLAAMFLPFLSQVLAITFGLWTEDRGLAKQGFRALAVSAFLSLIAGVLVAAIYKGPMLYSDFEPPLVSFAISSIIGIAAGLASADDAGRRYLISVAAAVQYAVLPVWGGIILVRGIPDSSILLERISAFFTNI